MKIPGLNRLQRIKQKLHKHWRSQGLILMYHRVAEADQDPWGLCVTPQYFAEQLEVLKTEAHPMSLRQMTQAYQSGRLPRRAVAITFDDGYADNLYQAKPLLEHYGLPATFFISTGYLGKEREFWWDELEGLLLRPGQLPDRLSLDIQGTIHDWALGPAVHYSQATYQDDCAGKVRAGEAPSGSRMAFYEAVWKVLLPLEEADRTILLDQLIHWANAEPTLRPTHRALSQEELGQLGRSELVEIGAHTVTHPFLSVQPLARQRAEIEQGKTNLEKLLTYPVTSFSYPFGDRSTDTVEMVRSLGFDYACSTVHEPVWRQSDPLQLPRYAVENWTAKEFMNQLSRWFYD
jgi:peptidoglycan/xylan/chitin deacetylase (PgdA/CDA1 family)